MYCPIYPIIMYCPYLLYHILYSPCANLVSQQLYFPGNINIKFISIHPSVNTERYGVYQLISKVDLLQCGSMEIALVLIVA